MERQNGNLPWHSLNPDVRFGKPCITGTRIDVATIVGLVATGETVETTAEQYQLLVDQIRAALAYAAHVAVNLPPAVRDRCMFRNHGVEVAVDVPDG
jgi:uncharacterized protein (DUF433 family)